MKNDNVLLAGRRPGDGDGIKIKFFPLDGHIRLSMLSQSGMEILGFELSGIEDLRELSYVVQRAVSRHEEMYPARETYLSHVREILGPQTDGHMAALINAKP